MALEKLEFFMLIFGKKSYYVLSDTWDEYNTFDLDNNQSVGNENPKKNKQIIGENIIGKFKIFLKIPF